jgi:hypothetical protein
VANTISAILPVILAQGASALRQNALMAQLINRDLQTIAQRKGNVVNVPIPSAIAARAVTPAVAFAANVDSSPTSFPVTLDQWYEAPIQLSDSDEANIDPMLFITMQATEAIKSLGNNVDSYILGKHTGFFAYTGTMGTTPFNGSLTVAASAKKLLSINLAPINDRRFVIDPSAEANLLVNQEVLQTQMRGDTGGIIAGTIGTKLGFDFYMNQNVTTFTPGTGWVTGFALSTVSAAAGDTTLNLINATASGTILVGDLFSIGGGSSQYTVTKTAQSSATVAVLISFYPPLRAAASVAVAITVVATAYTVNLAFHRDAWAFASRPLSGVFQSGNVFQAPTDPVSGIALRLELSRQYKQETLSYDVLYGANVIRPQLGCKVFG